LIDHTAIELDFILEMAAIDEPERFTFVRGGKVSGISETARELADWTKCLEGAALARHLAKSFVPPAWTRAPKPESGMTVGITRGGKAINAGNQNNG
jgi:hypothetical protein